ncbi:hypothetical protein [Sphingobacterium chuzhouense]|uniref:Uncharacterized protein n=1 Tax=Sphingobacterium chuzhouense TaxID=1742264 RepID=A0ABR7XPZ0_9SPHI|nr:hypothetical protein [Sphingobacterium chuzhouense]MBD1421223.1 hypothetical protein [Sphingobacterium chuzhouense]
MDFRYLPLLQSACEIIAENYDPQKKIQDFWEKYGANNSRLHVLNLFLFYKGETVLQEQLTIEEMKQFSQDLMTLLMAYYVAHREKINLDDIKIPVEETREENGEEGSFSDIPYTILGLHYLEQKLNR